MSKGHAFFIAGDRVIHIANPCGAGTQYRAHALTVAPGTLSEMQRHETADTIIAVTWGRLELMVDGFAAPLLAGRFARIAAGRTFAWRNESALPATLLIRTAPHGVARDAARVSIVVAA